MGIEPTYRVCARHTGFEVREAHQAPIRSRYWWKGLFLRALRASQGIHARRRPPRYVHSLVATPDQGMTSVSWRR